MGSPPYRWNEWRVSGHDSHENEVDCGRKAGHSPSIENLSRNPRPGHKKPPLQGRTVAGENVGDNRRARNRRQAIFSSPEGWSHSVRTFPRVPSRDSVSYTSALIPALPTPPYPSF